MKVAVFNTKPYDSEALNKANQDHHHELTFFKTRLSQETQNTVQGFDAVCVFVNDLLDNTVITTLAEAGVKLIVLRCAGFNNIDLAAAKACGIQVARVPEYSPNSVAEHTLALVMALARKTHKAYNRVRDGNFSLNGLLGIELHGRTTGIIGTGKIGVATGKIFQGFGCRVIAYDPYPSDQTRDMGIEYVSLEALYRQSDIISLNCPLTPDTHHLFNAETFTKLKPGAMLINTGRGAIIDTAAAVDAIKLGQLGYLGLDVYEQESDLFFEDLSNEIIHDDTFERLLTFPNVIITGHQGFFTDTAMGNIAKTTIENLTGFENNSLDITLVKA